MQRHCDNCRYWSQLIAKCKSGSEMEAFCLSASSSHHNHYTTGSTTCEHWRQNKFGAVDEGRDYGERIRQLYEIIEGHKP